MNKQGLKETVVVHEVDSVQMNIYPNYSSVYCHWHDEYEFLYITRGECVCLINGSSYTVGEGEIAIVGGGQLHSVHADKPVEIMAIVVHPHLCGADCMCYFNNRLVYSPFISRDDPLCAPLTKNLSEIISVFSQKPFGYTLRVKSLVTDCFARLIENGRYTDVASNSAASDTFEEIISFIHSNYREHITLEMLAKLSNYSSSYIIRLFRRHTGKTPTDYINNYRISKSQELLSNTDMSILSVCLESGFDSVSYYIRLFKKYVGMTPKQWRRSSK